MRPRNTVTLALALLAVAIVWASPAIGAETLENLPAKVRSNTGEGIGTLTYETLTGLKLVCEKTTSTGEESASKPPSGTFHMTITGCKSTIAGITVKCTGLGDATAGEILALGTWELVFDKNPLTEALTTALLFKVEPTHLTCAGFVLIVFDGTLLCLHVNPTVKSKTHEYKCEQEKATRKRSNTGRRATWKKRWNLNRK